jgi:CheY-like chemotaxis protein
MTQRILVVEDNPPNRELLCDWLESEDFEVLTAENLDQAYSVLRNQPPHAVLLDVKLGAEDGLVLAEWIRRQPALQHLPVIAVTAHAMVSDHERVIQAGCNSCISKPIDFKILSQQLNLWLAYSAKLQSSSCVS